MSRIGSFLKQRFGYQDHLGLFLDKPLPESVNWTVSLGGVIALLFVIQAATGMFLALYYNPSPDFAYASVDFIMGKVHLGPILRGIHHFGAGAMVVLVVVHLLASFFSGAFKPPREMTWMIGVCLFLLTLGFGFTGYLLPWDQKAFWATVVGANIPRDIPFVGNWITRIILAGETVSGLTLTRFYAIHTMILPALTAVCIGAHIYQVRIHGLCTSGDPHGSESVPPFDSSYRFFPDHVSRISIAFAVVFAVIIGLALFAEIPREKMAGTLDPAYLPRPEWYFMWLFQMLTFFSGKTEIIGSLVIPLAGLFLLFCLPFLSRSPLKSPSDRPLQTAIGTACLIGIVYLSAMGIANSGTNGDIIQIPDRKLTSSEQTGLNVFVSRECAYCHHILGKGGRREGPDLSNMTKKGRTKDRLIDFIRDPQAASRWSIMPKYDLTNEELSALAEFVLSLDFDRHQVKTVYRKQVDKGKI
jgi:ubiquinol-cytochrome c reductase cytochrome b subunit